MALTIEIVLKIACRSRKLNFIIACTNVNANFILFFSYIQQISIAIDFFKPMIRTYADPQNHESMSKTLRLSQSEKLAFWLCFLIHITMGLSSNIAKCKIFT